MSLSPPSGFEVLRREETDRVLVIRTGDESLDAWATQVDPEHLLEEHGEREGGGRGSIARIAVPAFQGESPGAVRSGPSTQKGRGSHHERPLVLKKYRHGGALAWLLPDVFPGYGRMLADLRTSEQARLKDVPCALVMGLILRRVGGIFWRGYLLTEEIEGAVTLDRALAEGRDPRNRPEPPDSGHSSWHSAHPTSSEAPTGITWTLAERAVQTVRRMHDAGILHRDLNVRNLLVSGGAVYLIDLDRAGMPSRVTASQRFSNLSRLDRSYLKVLGEGGPLSHDDRRRLLSIYCGADESMRRDFESRLAGHKRQIRWHKLSWRAQRRT